MEVDKQIEAELEEDKSADKLTALIENQEFENQAHEMEVARELFFESELKDEVEEEDDFYSPIEDEPKKKKKKKKAKKEKVVDDEYDSDEYYQKPKKSVGRVILKIILTLLILLLLAEIAVIGIKLLYPNSKAGEFVDEYITKTIDIFKGSDSEDLSDDEENNMDGDSSVRHKPYKDLSKIIADNENLNSANTIGAIEYSSNLKFSKNFDYQDKKISKSKSISDNLWYSEGEEYIYYDESAVESIIEYEVQRLNLINNQDDTVLNMVKENSELYDALEKEDGNLKEELKVLKIGEIRKNNNTVFVWVEENAEITQNGSTTKRDRKRVYSLEYEQNHVIKINGFENI